MSIKIIYDNLLTRIIINSVIWNSGSDVQYCLTGIIKGSGCALLSGKNFFIFLFLVTYRGVICYPYL